MAEANFDMAKISYGEVLDATKHQDDKIGRFLTAIAFLTAATVAFATRGVLHVQYQMGNAELPLVAVAIDVFLATIGLAALFFVLSLSTPLTLPQAVTTSSSTTSKLYFRQIARQSAQGWSNAWKIDDQKQEIANQYVTEAHNIALRADLKYQRQLEGTALFAVGVIAFVVVTLLSVDALANSSTDPATTRPMLDWTANRAWMLATPLALATLIINYQARQNRKQFDRGGVFISTVSTLVYAALVVLTIVPVRDGALRRLSVVAVIALLAVVVALVLSLTIHDVRSPLKDVEPPPTKWSIVRRVFFTDLLPFFVLVAGGVLGAVSLRRHWPHLQLLAATILVAALMVPTLSASWFTQQRS